MPETFLPPNQTANNDDSYVGTGVTRKIRSNQLPGIYVDVVFIACQPHGPVQGSISGGSR